MINKTYLLLLKLVIFFVILDKNKKWSNKIMKKLKKYISFENALCLFIIICPILDMSSFIFRNVFNVNISISTFVRPIIPIIIMIIIFLKNDKKFKLKSIGIFLLYLIYSCIHMILFYNLKTESSYGGILSEARYIINYSFMIMNLFIYTYVFKNKNTNKLRISVLIALTIYILSIYISILTKTSSHTYGQQNIGYKGWFESGNSICIVLLLSIFIISGFIKERKYRLWSVLVIVLTGIFLSTLLGTRLGLIGFILFLVSYIGAEIFTNLINKTTINKQVIIAVISIIVVLAILMVIFGSNTIKRRQNLKEMNDQILDSNGEISNITGDLLEIKENIEANKITENYMKKENQYAILDLYNFAKEYNLENTNRRMQELMYQLYLVKYQASPIVLLFGNGYMTHFAELILEMEIVAFILNFGIIGFCVYYLPFLVIYFYGLYISIKNIKKLDTYNIMIIIGITLSFASSFFAGYTFFNSSSATLITILSVLLLNNVYRLKQDNVKQIEAKKGDVEGTIKEKITI